MLNYGDDAGGDELVMVTIYLIDDDDDCICMITNLNSPSVFRMWELRDVWTVIWLWCSLAYLASPSNAPDIAVRLEIRPYTVQGCRGIRQQYANGLWHMQTFRGYVNKQTRLYVNAWLTYADIFVHLSVSFPVVHWLLVFSRHTCPFTGSSHVEFPCFITLSLSFTHFTSGLPRPRLPSRPVHYYLRPPAILHAYYMSIPFQHFAFHSLQNRLCYPHFPLVTSFLMYSSVEILTA